jgi:hypothetical protein
MRAAEPRDMAERFTMKRLVQQIFKVLVSIFNSFNPRERGNFMNRIVYIIGVIVVVLAVLSFFGFR